MRWMWIWLIPALAVTGCEQNGPVDLCPPGDIENIQGNQFCVIVIEEGFLREGFLCPPQFPNLTRP